MLESRPNASKDLLRFPSWKTQKRLVGFSASATFSSSCSPSITVYWFMQNTQSKSAILLSTVMSKNTIKYSLIMSWTWLAAFQVYPACLSLAHYQRRCLREYTICYKNITTTCKSQETHHHRKLKRNFLYSRMSSCLNSLSGTVYEDFLKPYMPNASEKKASTIMKTLTFTIGE